MRPSDGRRALSFQSPARISPASRLRLPAPLPRLLAELRLPLRFVARRPRRWALPDGWAVIVEEDPSFWALLCRFLDWVVVAISQHSIARASAISEPPCTAASAVLRHPRCSDFGG